MRRCALHGLCKRTRSADAEALTPHAGYNPKGVLGYGDWRDAISAFLFTWPDGNTRVPALKLPKTAR